MSHIHPVPGLNQTPPLSDYNLFTTDAALQEAVRRGGAGSAAAALERQGAAIGTAANFEHGRLANRHPPQLNSFDVRGERIDLVEFHPSWHALMEGIIAHGYHSGPWGSDTITHETRAAGYFLQAQVESGTLCPTTMTYGAIAAMRRDPGLSRSWLPALLSRQYDPRDVALDEKRGGLVGMGMTEKQGGSDVRANTSRAERCADGSYRITGHKWFFSAPQCDAHLVLAQADGGLSCFFMPRRLPDGSRNAIVIQRLKDKLGNRSNASAEVEFQGAWAHLLGEEGRGVPTILEMGTYTRLDCAIGSAGLMRQALVRCLHHARHRRAFGAPLIDQPLMRGVLVDLALESEAATALALRLARAFDGAGEAEVAVRRVLTPAAKFWICKRGCEFMAEAMEVLGGNGYTEELPLARMEREMPVNSIWEGSGNIMCLDVLRAFGKSALTREVVLQELSAAHGHHPDFDARVAEFSLLLAGPLPESGARRVTQLFVTLLQARLLLDGPSGPEARAAAEAFCASRLGNERWGAVYGTAAPVPAARSILDRAWHG